MTKTTLSITLAALIGATTPTLAAWDSDGTVAFANRGEPILTGVVVRGYPACNDVTVFITGPEAMPTTIGVMVDNTSYDIGTPFDAGEDDSIAALSISQPTLDALMSGDIATVVTDEDAITVSLVGSRAAINSAYDACRSGQ